MYYNNPNSNLDVITFIMTLHRIKYLIITVLLLNSYYAISQKAKSPNIIVIMADDLGYTDVGFNGCKDIPTPNINRIAENGVKFTNGYTSYSVCGPSRAGFLTGRYGQRFGFERNPQYSPDKPNMGLPKTENTIAESLKKVNYKSGIIGKWHMGAYITDHPLSRGFDEFFGHLGGGHQYFPDSLTIKDSYKAKTETDSYRTWIMRNHEPVKIKKYLTDEFSDEAAAFIERNKDESFFLFLSYNAPHTPLQASKKYLDRFKNIQDKKRRTYAAMVSAVDDGVGQVLDKLEALNLDENTLVFFLSDNGGPETKNASDNGPLREGKSSIYEGGYRVPFAFQWKGHVAPGTYNNPVSSLDIFATISSLSNSPVLAGKPLDGVNLIPYLNGDKKDELPHKTIHLRKFDQDLHAIRDHDLKLVVKWKNSKKELYNLKEDIGEENDLSSQFPDEVKRLDKMRLEWESHLIDPIFPGLAQLDERIKKMAKAKKKKATNE